jgi:hypothetical protein
MLLMLSNKLLHSWTLALLSKFESSLAEAELSEANSHIFIETITEHLDEKLNG